MSLNHSKYFIEISNSDTIKERINKATKVVPTKNQLEWQKLELTAFIHYGINTYSDLEWGDGTASPLIFNPKFVDCEQWVRTLKEAGFKGIILTCKHHDGFCLWPSLYTDYSVKSSPYMNGSGDIVKQCAEASKKYNLKFGIYLSPWDRHDDRYGEGEKYNEYFLNQLTELLTNYGEIYEVWFDGACAEGKNGKMQDYDWNSYYLLIRKLQPNAVISVMGPDVRWVGNEAGNGREEEWSVVPGAIVNKEKEFAFITADTRIKDIASDKALENLPCGTDCLFWSPAQVDTSIRPGWFYHTWENGNVKSLYELVNIYENSVGSNAQLLLNIPPDTKGKISPWDVDRLIEFGSYIQNSYKHNLCDLPYTIEKSNNIRKININFKNKVKCNCVIIEENIENGQKVSAFEIFAKINEKLFKIADGKTIGHKKIVKFDKIETDFIVINITSFRDEPQILNVGTYLVPSIACPPSIKRDKNGMVKIVSVKADKIRYSIDDGEMLEYTEAFYLEKSAKVLAEAEYSESYMSNSSTISCLVQFGVLKNEFTAIPNTPDFDNFVKGYSPYIIFNNFPSEIIIDMNKIYDAIGIMYTPISFPLDFMYNVYEIEIFTSLDNKKFVKSFKGTLDNIKNNPISTFIKFKNNVECRYLKFKALKGFHAKKAGIGSIDIVTK